MFKQMAIGDLASELEYRLENSQVVLIGPDTIQGLRPTAEKDWGILLNDDSVPYAVSPKTLRSFFRKIRLEQVFPDQELGPKIFDALDSFSNGSEVFGLDKSLYRMLKFAMSWQAVDIHATVSSSFFSEPRVTRFSLADEPKRSLFKAYTSILELALHIRGLRQENSYIDEDDPIILMHLQAEARGGDRGVQAGLMVCYDECDDFCTVRPTIAWGGMLFQLGYVTADTPQGDDLVARAKTAIIMARSASQALTTPKPAVPNLSLRVNALLEAAGVKHADLRKKITERYNRDMANTGHQLNRLAVDVAAFASRSRTITFETKSELEVIAGQLLLSSLDQWENYVELTFTKGDKKNGNEKAPKRVTKSSKTAVATAKSDPSDENTTSNGNDVRVSGGDEAKG